MSLFYSGRSIFYDEVIPPAVMMRIQKQHFFELPCQMIIPTLNHKNCLVLKRSHHNGGKHVFILAFELVNMCDIVEYESGNNVSFQ